MISVENAEVRIDDAVLLAPTSLTVTAGSWSAVRGANGTGKSTLLSLLAAVRPPTSGTVTINEAAPNATDKQFRAAVSSLLGAPIVSRDLTLREHLTLLATSWSDPEPLVRAESELDRWQISHLATRFPHEVSSGQRQLFALSCAFIRPADILILDEPEQRLDASRRSILVEAVRARTAQGATIVMATHADDVAAAADEVTWLASND